MPKNKTHSGASKRFRVTGTGKIAAAREDRAASRHNLEHRKPSQGHPPDVRQDRGAKADDPSRKKMLGHLTLTAVRHPST